MWFQELTKNLILFFIFFGLMTISFQLDKITSCALFMDKACISGYGSK